MPDAKGLWGPLFEWIKSLPDPLEYALVASVIFVAVVVGWLALTNTIQLKAMWSILRKRSSDESPHLHCPDRDDGEAYSHASREYERAISQGAADLLRRQMDHLEQTMSAMTGELRSTFINLVADADPEVDPARSRDVRHFALVLKHFSGEMLHTGRGYFKRNGFSKMTDAEFSEYKHTKSTALRFMGTELLDMYYDGTLVSRERLYEANKPSQPKIIKAICDTLDNARAESVAYYKDLDAKKRAFDYYHDRFHKRWGKEEPK